MTDRPPAMKVLVLQGGGALGSYQAGVFEALAQGGHTPDFVAGISIGAINAALIAGNPAETCIARLIEFWELVTSGFTATAPPLGDGFRQSWNEMAASFTVARGAPGFFKPLFPPAVSWLKGPLGYYDTSPLRATLERLVDFDRIHDGPMRLAVGAVNVETGNFKYFDSRDTRIGPEHIMASGALPPGFPPVEIDGEWWWDGGLVSNTPLDYVLDVEQARDLMIFQVDLFAARGPMPQTIGEAGEREKDIRFSSRTRFNTDQNMRLHKARCAFRALVAKLPPELRDGAEVQALNELATENAVAIAQLIYRDKPYEGSAKDYEFSRATMAEHWTAGHADAARALKKIGERPVALQPGIASFDFSREKA